VYTYSGGEKPVMMVDSSMSQKTPAGNVLYLQNVVVTVK
jgi:hypothetical protein